MCKMVGNSFSTWPAYRAALQCGGLEIRGRGRLASAIERWIRRRRRRLLVVPEYRIVVPGNAPSRRLIDLAAVFPTSEICESCLEVDTVFEVKSNYASQSSNRKGRGEIARRLESGLKQADAYKKAVGAKSAFLLYIVTEPRCIERPPQPRDAGWRHWRQAEEASLMNQAITTVENASGQRKIIGRSKSGQISVWLLSP